MTDELPRFEPRTDPRPEDTAWPEMTWPPRVDVLMRGSTVELVPYVEERDLEALWDALDHPEVWAHLPMDPQSCADLGATISKRASKGFFTFIVRLVVEVNGVPAGSTIGMTCYLDIAPSDARLEIGGTAYARSVWSTAVNPEAKLLLLRYAFEELRCGRVQIKTDVRNQRSQQAIARLGAVYEGTLRRNNRRSDDTMRDTVMFSIIAEEWPAVRARLEERLAR